MRAGRAADHGEQISGLRLARWDLGLVIINESTEGDGWICNEVVKVSGLKPL